MAIYHFSAKVIGRSGGRSAIASAAYRAGERLHDKTLDRDHDYTAKTGVVHSEILLPAGAPERWRDRATLWNEAEAAENRKDAQLARDIEISLPREMGKAAAIQLAQDFVREQFVARGMVADLNVHWTNAADGAVQPHAHVMLTMRAVVPGREGQEEPEGREETNEAAFGKKVVAWNDRALLGEWRERWATLANERLLEHGLDVRIDHRSYAAQGIELEPQNKIGPAGRRREDRGEQAERADEHLRIARRNGEKIIEEPGVALDAITRQQSTFTRQDLARFVSRHTADKTQFDQAMARAEAAPELVRLGTDGRQQDRFTTRDMLAVEQRMERAAAKMTERDGHRLSRAAGWRALKQVERGGLTLGDEQRAAYQRVTSGADLSLVVGYAGTGKSAMFSVAREAWETVGYRVRGAALSGIAAEGFEAGSGIASRTLASLEYGWTDGRDVLTGRDVLVIDEAGLVGSRQMERVLSAAQAAGAKVVLVGDPEQLQAIEAGAAFRALADRHGAAEISEVRRQQEDWQRAATRELATERTAQALERYAAAGMVQAADTREAARTALVAGWDAVRRQSPQASQVILAYTRDDVRELNDLARETMRVGGALRGEDQVVQTERGSRAFAAGDRLMFQRNERALGGHFSDRDTVAVKNGTLGTVLEVASGGERLTVRLDGAGVPSGHDKAGERVVTFYTRDYAHIDHGYAATIHKAQGVTVDRTHVLASRHMDRHAAYVALTRHRDGVALHYGRDEFADAPALARTLGRQRLKDTSLDYDADRARDELVRRYAERRGLDPLHPVSEIVVRAAADRAADSPAPRRSKFAGLKLGTGRSAPDRGPEPDAPVVGPKGTERRPEETPEARLERVLGDYARAWGDAAGMERMGLPVLPHQTQALARAGAALEQTQFNLSQDARAALERSPELTHGHNRPEGIVALGDAVDAARRARIALDERGLAAVRAWKDLERDYETAGQGYDSDIQRRIGARLEAFAKELKRDPELDGVLRKRGRELGIAEGSRLEQVVQAREIDRRLLRSLDLEHGPRRDSGLSLER